MGQSSPLFANTLQYMHTFIHKVRYQRLKAAVLQMLKDEEKKMVNTGQVMFSGEIYYY